MTGYKGFSSLPEPPTYCRASHVWNFLCFRLQNFSLLSLLALCMSKYCSLTRILLPIHIACQIYTLLKTLFHISYLHGRFFWKMKFTPKMPISFLLILQNCQLIMIMWFQYYFHHIIIVMLTICQLILVNSPMFPYVLVSLRSVYIVIVPYIDPLWSS